MFRHQARLHIPAAEGEIVSLVDLVAGSTGLVHRLRGRRLLVIRLSALGFSIGVRVSVLRNDGHGPLIVGVRGTRVVLGRGAASKILIEVAGNAAEPVG